MGIIRADEMEDFRAALSENGYSEKDFKLTELPDRVPPGVIDPLSGTAIVRFKKTGIEREYRIGRFSHWIVDFEEDI